MTSKESARHANDLLDVRRIGTDVTSKITLTPGQSALGWLLTANTTIISVVGAFLPWYTGGAMFTLPLIITAFVVLVVIPDILFLPYMKRNIARVEAAGYSRAEWILGMCFSLSLVCVYSWLPPQIFSNILDAEPRFTAEFFIKSATCMVIPDVVFEPLHRLLHRHLTNWHMLHHLCIDSSIASSFVIEPIDALCEFAAPAALMLFLALGVLQDPWVHLGATAMMTVWVLLSHDPQVKLQHWYHHAHCDSRYTLYFPIKLAHDPKDTVRAEVFKIRQQERDSAKIK